MTLCERPQRQQHYREMDRWKKRRRIGEQTWNESSNRMKPSSRPLTYWSQTAAMLERHPGSDLFCVSKLVFLLLQKTLVESDSLWNVSERFTVVFPYKQTNVLCFSPKKQPFRCRILHIKHDHKICITLSNNYSHSWLILQSFSWLIYWLETGEKCVAYYESPWYVIRCSGLDVCVQFSPSPPLQAHGCVCLLFTAACCRQDCVSHRRREFLIKTNWGPACEKTAPLSKNFTG